MPGFGQRQGVAVGGRVHHVFRTHWAFGAGFVVADDWSAQYGLHALG